MPVPASRKKRVSHSGDILWGFKRYCLELIGLGGFRPEDGNAVSRENRRYLCRNTIDKSMTNFASWGDAPVSYIPRCSVTLIY